MHVIAFYAWIPIPEGRSSQKHFLNPFPGQKSCSNPHFVLPFFLVHGIAATNEH
jgi:hypothetical protein